MVITSYTGTVVVEKSARGFESHSLRHIKRQAPVSFEVGANRYNKFIIFLGIGVKSKVRVLKAGKGRTLLLTCTIHSRFFSSLAFSI